VPRDDHVWLRRRGHTRIVDDDDWGFVGNDKESRTRAFASTCCACVTVSAPTSASRHAPETHCGRRCTTTTAAWAAPSLTHCSSGGGSTLRGRNATERRRVPHLADNGFVLRRTIGWARRTRAEVRALREARRDTRRKAPPSDADGPLQLCATALDEGLKCVAESGARRAITVSLPDADCYSLHQHELCHTHRCGGAAARCSRRRPRFHAAIAAAHTARRRQQGGGRRTPRCRATLPLAEAEARRAQRY
jgi:hypothetical protein